MQGWLDGDEFGGYYNSMLDGSILKKPMVEGARLLAGLRFGEIEDPANAGQRAGWKKSFSSHHPEDWWWPELKKYCKRTVSLKRNK